MGFVQGVTRLASKAAANKDCRRVTQHLIKYCLNNPIFMRCKMPEFFEKSPLSGDGKTP
jgi:hypothetical protein